MPTLVLYGEADVPSPREVAKALHEQIRDSELAFLPEVGHMANVEAPERFNAEIRRFLETVDVDHQTTAGRRGSKSASVGGQ